MSATYSGCICRRLCTLYRYLFGSTTIFSILMPLHTYSFLLFWRGASSALSQIQYISIQYIVAHCFGYRGSLRRRQGYRHFIYHPVISIWPAASHIRSFARYNMAFSTKLIGRHTSGTTGYSSLTSLAPLLPVSTTQHQGNTSSSNRSPTQTHGSPSVDSSDDKEAKHHRTERSGKYTKALFMFTALVLGLSGCLFAFWTWNAGHTCVPTSSGRY
jgi:hypothetical protein